MIALESRPIRPGEGHTAGRQLLAEMVGKYAHRSLPDIVTGERGKPYFAESDLHFSISHTPRHVFCALSDRPIGIDAEELDRQVDLRLAQKILSAHELSQFSAAADPRLALLTFWVLKESAAKCTGEGLRGYPDHTRFSLDDPRVQILDGCLVAVTEA